VAASTSQWNTLIWTPCIRISVKSSTVFTEPRRNSWLTRFFYSELLGFWTLSIVRCSRN
jgi:hypothetical protein